MSRTLIVDGANVVGSVPDGWWRDRAGAARRLRDALAPVAERGIAGTPGPFDVILVVEGAARDVTSSKTVSVVPAPGSGDDAIVELVTAVGAGGPGTEGGVVVVVTSDRGLRDRVAVIGATVVGPRSLPYP